MRYLMLILADEKAWANLSKKEVESVYQQYRAYGEELARATKNLDGSELEPTSTACRIRMTNGKPRVTDGPFTETKEVVGGYFLFDADTREEAVRLASRCPGAATGTVELYPLKPSMDG